MRQTLPRILSEAIASGIWRSPGRQRLGQLIAPGLDLPDLELFRDEAVMRRVSDQLAAGGYVDDPEFCMIRIHAAEDQDPRLVFERAVFIAGSTIPGDDVFVALDSCAAADPQVLVLDWGREVPNRWVNAGSLSGLLQKLST